MANQGPSERKLASYLNSMTINGILFLFMASFGFLVPFVLLLMLLCLKRTPKKELKQGIDWFDMKPRELNLVQDQPRDKSYLEFVSPILAPFYRTTQAPIADIP